MLFVNLFVASHLAFNDSTLMLPSYCSLTHFHIRKQFFHVLSRLVIFFLQNYKAAPAGMLSSRQTIIICISSSYILFVVAYLMLDFQHEPFCDMSYIAIPLPMVLYNRHDAHRDSTKYYTHYIAKDG